MQPYICKKKIERTNPILDIISNYTQNNAKWLLIRDLAWMVVLLSMDE